MLTGAGVHHRNIIALQHSRQDAEAQTPLAEVFYMDSNGIAFPATLAQALAGAQLQKHHRSAETPEHPFKSPLVWLPPRQ